MKHQTCNLFHGAILGKDLSQEYDPVVITITAKQGTISIQETLFLLMRFESRLEQFTTNTYVELSNTSANVQVKSQIGDLNNTQRGGQFRGRGRGFLASPKHLLVQTWHNKLGHHSPCSHVLSSVLKSLNINVSTFQLNNFCDACKLSKLHRLPYTSFTHIYTAPLEMICADV
ncbi:hypothetical protein Dsin_016692 [Dipteronia sinensis]|uniref:GAG-pre-integrase domain-containing protein n=1 Tax=Dipteronia sinensis TaxID=43782 RepID=A0AAE0E5R1_9ROSI|nr:hypothetical protein Dsin_016692 [Dipteronia sinensis]